MNCKNCNSILFSENKFCPNCGGKIVKNRLTFRHLFNEFNEQVLSLDNKLFKTFWHLVKSPDKVVLAYINGVRKKYLNPFSFLLIVLTISGISIYLTRDIAIDGVANITSEVQKEGMKKTMNFLYDYNSIFVSILIPFYALISMIVFYNKKKFNYVEHNILFIYSQAIFSILGIITSLFLFVFSIKSYFTISFLPSILWIIYNTFLFKKIFKLNAKQTVLKVFYFIFIFLIMYILLTVLFMFTMYFIEGPEYFKQFQPK